MINIRLCTREDLHKLAALFTRVFNEPPYLEHWSIPQAAAYLGRFLDIDPNGCLIAIDDRETVGAIIGYTYSWRSELNYFVQELFVHQGRRKEGIGRRLVHHAILQHGKSATVSLIANERSKAARFYESLGLQQHKTYKFYCGTVRT